VKKLLVVVWAVSVSALATEAPIEWPYPEDIPTASSAVPRPAGEVPYDIVRFLKTRGPRAARISPDGNRLTFLSTVTGEPQLFGMPTQGGAPQQMTFGRAVTFYEWSPDSHWLVYGGDRDGNEREAYTLIGADGRQERQLSESGPAFLAFGSFTNSGARVAFASTLRNGKDFDVYVRSVEGGDAQLIHEGSFGFYARAWHPDDIRLLIAETRGEDGNNLYLLDSTTGALDTLFKPEIGSRYVSATWLKDGSGFYLATDQDRNFVGLGFYELETRELTMLETPERDVANVTLFYNQRYLAWTVNEDGYDRLHVFDRQEQEAVDVPELPAGVYGLSGAHQTALLSVHVTGPRTPGEIWLWDLAAQRTRLAVPATLAGIDPATLVDPESVRFAARDGVGLQGLLYRPNNLAANVRPPLMLKVHGGPNAQARPRFDATVQYLVGRGYAVFDLNYRGSNGFGKAFARLDNGRLRAGVVNDIEDAVRWLGEHAEIDPSRVAIMGGSYGGYLTNAAVGEFPGLFKAAVSFVGVSDWVRALEEASPALKASDRVEYGDINDPDDRAFFAEISPIAKAHLVRTPLLVVHGANDPRDPVTESDRFVKAVREQEVDVKYLRFADEGHNLTKLGNRVTAYRAIARFLDEKLQ
jgi:dipeptidyl aminopeptidase/acylaminoacyl peptidase